MSAQEDAELVRRGYEAFIAGDMEWLNDHLHENVVWHVPGHNVTSGDYRGRESVLGFFAKSVQIALPEFEMHDNDDTFEDRIGQVFHLLDGQVVEVWTMGEDLAGFDRFLEGVAP